MLSKGDISFADRMLVFVRCAARNSRIRSVDLAAFFAPFGHTFTSFDPFPMVTTKVLFNDGGFGTSTAVDFRNLITTIDLAATDAGFALDFFGLARTSEDIVQVSINMAAHELEHVLGARHHDAYNPVGSGTGGGGTSSTFQSLTTVLGIDADRIIAPELYISPHTALKMTFADSGVVVSEGSEPNDSIPTAVPIVFLPFPMPNTLPPSDPLFGALLTALAVVVTGELDPGTADLVDYFKFDGTAGQIVSIEVMSDVLDHRLDPFDPKLELLDGAGTPLAGIITDSIDGSDPILFDFTLPADGPYFIEVASEGMLPGLGEYELLVYGLGAISELPPCHL